MPRQSKGARLWLRPARRKAGRVTHPSVWLIRDGSHQQSTGCLAHDSDGAEVALARYLASKHVRTARERSRDPEKIPVADVLTIYLQDVVVPRPRVDDAARIEQRRGHSRPHETKTRIKFLSNFFGDKVLSEVNGETCRAYVAQRSTDAAARRELEELRAAINHHRREGLHDRIISVALPGKSASREAWLERENAAAAIWAAWRYREVQQREVTDRYTRRHVARFMVFARYMGSRASVICNASIEPIRPAGLPWCDLRHGVFYGLPRGQRQSKKRRQIVQIPPSLLAHLRRWQRLGHRYVVEWNGGPVKRITKAHNAAIKDAHLGKEITPHIWRHTVATWLMQEGADPWKSALFLAMSLETLLRVYGHHRPDSSADVHRALAGKKTAPRQAPGKQTVA
jgi:integrase